MNVVGIIHEELAKLGIEVISVSEDGTIVFADGVSGDQKKEAWLFLGNFKRPSRVEIMEKIRADKESLLEQLLLERFYPNYAGDDDGGSPNVR